MARTVAARLRHDGNIGVDVTTITTPTTNIYTNGSQCQGHSHASSTRSILVKFT
jgi:hypothetical protein